MLSHTHRTFVSDLGQPAADAFWMVVVAAVCPDVHVLVQTDRALLFGVDHEWPYAVQGVVGEVDRLRWWGLWSAVVHYTEGVDCLVGVVTAHSHYTHNTEKQQQQKWHPKHTRQYNDQDLYPSIRRSTVPCI